MTDGNRIVRVGLIKAIPVKWGLAANWALFEFLFRRAVRRGAQIVCTPECFLDGYAVTEDDAFPEPGLALIAQPLEGPGYVSRARALADECGVYLVFGFTQRADQGGFYNAAALIDASGQIVGCYHKTHLLNHDLRFLPGEDLPVWETPLGRIGMMICADRRWPETARTLRVRGAEIIMNPTYGMWHLDNEWWMRTRSYENELFVCFTHPQVSLITGPRGELAAKLQSNVADVLVHDIDLATNPDTMFAARRPEVYHLG